MIRKTRQSGKRSDSYFDWKQKTSFFWHDEQVLPTLILEIRKQGRFHQKNVKREVSRTHTHTYKYLFWFRLKYSRKILVKTGSLLLKNETIIFKLLILFSISLHNRRTSCFWNLKERVICHITVHFHTLPSLQLGQHWLTLVKILEILFQVEYHSKDLTTKTVIKFFTLLPLILNKIVFTSITGQKEKMTNTREKRFTFTKRGLSFYRIQIM